MTELARGSVGDRPWGLTLGALGMRGLTGQLILAADGKRYQIAFDGGAIIGATSPLGSDAAVRIAMTGGLLSSTQVADIARRQQANPNRDEVDLIAELIRLAPDQAMKLRRRAIAQRAARTFSIERGDFVVDDRITLPIVPGAELDIRAVIFLGARSNLSEARLANELAQFGGWFQLKAEALVDLPQYGFARADDQVLDVLERGAPLADLEVVGSEPHVVRAMLYALVSCSALDSDGQPAARAPARPVPTTQRQPLQGMPSRQTQPQARPPAQPPARHGEPPPGRQPGQPQAWSPQGQPQPWSPQSPQGSSQQGQPQPWSPQSPQGSSQQGQPQPWSPQQGPRGSSQQNQPAQQQPQAWPPRGQPQGSSQQGQSRQPAQQPQAWPPQQGQPPRPPQNQAQQPQARPAEPRPEPARHQPPQQPPAPQGFDPPTTRRHSNDDAFDGATVRRPSGIDAPTSARGAIPRGRVTNADPNQAAEVRALIKKHLELLKGRADHFKLLGSHVDATPDELRKAYFALARQLHPDRLSALGIADDNKEAQRLFAQCNTAFGVVSDPKRRQEYTSVLRRGGEAAIAKEQARAEEMASRILDAEEAFARGEAALRRDQLATALSEFARALELNSEEVDYHAAYAWAEFCGAPDKMAVASKTRVTLDRAINKSPRSISPRFYAGRVERMLGRDADALRHFQEVLRLEPHHREAASEARVIEQRLAGGKKR